MEEFLRSIDLALKEKSMADPFNKTSLKGFKSKILFLQKRYDEALRLCEEMKKELWSSDASILVEACIRLERKQFPEVESLLRELIEKKKKYFIFFF